MMVYRAGGLFAGVSEDALKENISREPFRPIWERIVAQWAQAAEEDAGQERITFRYACGSSYVTPQLREAAVIHRLTGDARARAHIHRQIDKLATIWSDPPHSLKEHVGGRTTYFSDAEACLAADLCRDALDGERFQTLLRLARDHFIDDNDGEHALFNYAAGHNIPFTRMLAAGVCALVLGEEAGHPGWQRVVDLTADACKLFCRWGFDEDGVSYEASLYGMAVAAWMYPFAELLYQRGGEDLFAAIPGLERIADASAHLLFPDRSGLISPGDSTYVMNHLWSPLLLLTARHYQRPRDLALWHETYYARLGDTAQPSVMHLPSLLWWDGAIPPPLASFTPPTAFCAAGTATATFRTGWSHDAVFLNVLGQGRSHASHGHTHADAGHFTLMAHGELLAVDIGYWNLNEDQHNVVMIDGQGRADSAEGWYGLQPHAGRFDRFQRHALLDYLLVDARAPKACAWADRHVLFVPLGGDDAYLLLVDNINVDNAKHGFWWQLHAPRQSVIEITGERTATIARPAARLDCTFISPLPEDFPDEPHTLVLRADEKCSADPPHERKTHPRLIAEQTGVNGQLVTVMVPRRPGAPALTVRNATTRRTFRVEIDHGDFTDTFIAGLDHAYLRFPDVRGMAELALIRRDRVGKLMDYWTADGARLDFPASVEKGTI